MTIFFFSMKKLVATIFSAKEPDTGLIPPGSRKIALPGDAFDLFFEGDEEQARKTLESAFPGADVIVQEEAGRRKKMLVSDMESTIIANEFLDEIAAHLGIGPKIAEITARAMNGELDFRESLLARIALVKGVRRSELLEIYGETLKINPGAEALVSGMKKEGALTVLVSGGFTLFARPVAETLGFDLCFANELEFDSEERLSGVKEPVLGKEAKLEIMTRLCAERGIAASEVLALGDGANDLPMLQAAGLGIAYHAKPKVREAVKHKISHGDLSAALAAQGLTPL